MTNKKQKHSKRKTKPEPDNADKPKRQFIIWTAEEEDILRKVFPHQTPEEILKLIPYRTWESIEKRAHRLGLKKTTEYISAKQSSNRLLTGYTHLADVAAEALGKKYPDHKIIYEALVKELLSDPAVDVTNHYTVQQIKKAALMEVTQMILVQDRLEAGLKGKQLLINPKTGNEVWVEARYPHGPDIHADYKTARQILKDLGIVANEPAKIDVTANISFLWEEGGLDKKMHEAAARHLNGGTENYLDDRSDEDSHGADSIDDITAHESQPEQEKRSSKEGRS